VQFQCLDHEEIQRFEVRQTKLKHLMKLSRGKNFSPWNYGEMRPMGSRKPIGGRPGDAYGPYPGVIVESLEDIETLFGHTEVSP
jgi:hypothetical protein